jgi:rhodanese-related sulfurtransferase
MYYLSQVPTLITRDELHAKITSGNPPVIFEVLGLPYWRKHHIPGALNMPPDRMLETAREVVPDRTTEIVLYCWDDDCPTSGWAARELEADGYTNVREYSGGKKDWQEGGLPLVKN